MFYTKNLPGWERVLRVMMGLGLLAASLGYFGPNLAGWGAGLAAAMALMSGLFGFCPACAMVGRKLQNQEPHS